MTMKTNQLADLITQAIGPIFQKHPTYSVIIDAMCIVMARVIQSTPEPGSEYDISDYTTGQIRLALDNFLEIERSQVTPAMQAVDGFADFACDGLENIVPLKNPTQ